MRQIVVIHNTELKLGHTLGQFFENRPYKMRLLWNELFFRISTFHNIDTREQNIYQNIFFQNAPNVERKIFLFLEEKFYVKAFYKLILDKS